ncbi:hypothetical protein EVJ58_g6023 [Rhodofomes roseus]|uniref:histone acetyltransferase n=1 Tax=Rhodofomes roseus TaxID=34475 RepID=A0A4Y9YAX7_9APHY|nr:hypothetical protein EVJ58_g6023 [Rhodofomes roseus]
MSLRDALLASLATLPGRREFHIHVLVSAPRKRTDLYPYAKPRPRAYLQDIVILLSEQTTFDGPRVVVSAIEAALYNIPATSCGILYISKVDSTGQASRPSPTATLVRAFLRHYADPSTRPIAADHLWIQLFARAQGQYLFPNSAEFSGKKPLADVQLCAWWKRILTDVTRELRESRGDVMIRPYYLLPGYNELEATQSLRMLVVHPPADAPAEFAWIYGHPYSQAETPLPCPPATKEGNQTNLGHFIPSFDDDPKSRFMDEIAHTTNADGVSSPKRKRRKTGGSRPEPPSDDEDEDRGRGELNKVSPEEFWERMSFRQECISGVVTAFFVVALSSPRNHEQLTISAPSPLAPQPGQVSSKMVRRVIRPLRRPRSSALLPKGRRQARRTPDHPRASTLATSLDIPDLGLYIMPYVLSLPTPLFSPHPPMDPEEAFFAPIPDEDSDEPTDEEIPLVLNSGQHRRYRTEGSRRYGKWMDQSVDVEFAITDATRELEARIAGWEMSTGTEQQSDAIENVALEVLTSSSFEVGMRAT